MTNLNETFDEIERLADEQNLPEVEREAAEILARRKIQDDTVTIEIPPERMAQWAVDSLDVKAEL